MSAWSVFLVVARRKVSRLYVTAGCEWESYGNDGLLIRSMESGSVRELRPAIPWLNAANTCPVWAPDGSSLLVTARDKDGGASASTVSTRRAVWPLPSFLRYKKWSCCAPLSPDGRTLF